MEGNNAKVIENSEGKKKQSYCQQLYQSSTLYEYISHIHALLIGQRTTPSVVAFTDDK